MAARNSGRIAKMYKKAEGLFSHLEAVLTQYDPLCLVAVEDIKASFELNLTEVDTQWMDSTVEAFKAKYKDVEKNIPNIYIVDPGILLSTRSFKNQLMDTLQTSYNFLLEAVHDKFFGECQTMETFASSSSSLLNSTPSTLEDVAAAKEGLNKIKRDAELMKTLHRKCLGVLRRVLKYSSWSKDSEHYRGLFSKLILGLEVEEVCHTSSIAFRSVVYTCSAYDF